MPDDLPGRDRGHFSAILEKALARLREAGVDATGTLRVWEPPAEAIGAFAGKLGAELVVIGHHRRSAIDRWWRGSVGHSLLEHLPCS